MTNYELRIKNYRKFFTIHCSILFISYAQSIKKGYLNNLRQPSFNLFIEITGLIYKIWLPSMLRPLQREIF